MLGANMRFGRGNGEDRFYCHSKARRGHYNHPNEHTHPRNRGNGGGSWGFGPLSPAAKGNDAYLDDREPENRVGCEEASKPGAVPASPRPAETTATIASPSNLERFLESTAPSVPAQYLSKTTMRVWRTCDVESQPYFTLGDLWESFKEWSVYGAGVPLVLNGRDSFVQYYVPYLSGIQLYAEPRRQLENPRRPGEDSDSDCYRDSSSDGSSDCEVERSVKYLREWSRYHPIRASMLGSDEHLLKDQTAELSEGFSSDDSEMGNIQNPLLFEFYERDIPYSRVPLADKISELARHFPELITRRSCDLLPASWMSVAWYPIYRIPTGPTLRDLDACFLTYHSLSTPFGDASDCPSPIITHSQGSDSVPQISLPVFGLASYKLKGSVWTPNGGCKRQLANSLSRAADNWLRLLHVNHPDYQFFVSRGSFRR